MAASLARALLAMSTSRMKRPSSSWPTAILLRLTNASLDRGEISVEPAAHHGPDPRRFFREQEVIEAGEQMQLARLAGALEHFHRLLGRRHRILGGVDEEQRPRRDIADHFLGAEIEHALCGFRRKHLDRIWRQHADLLLVEIVLHMARDRHDVVARHHQRLAGAGAMFAAFLEHLGELRPTLRRRMLSGSTAGCLARKSSALPVSSTCSRQMTRPNSPSLLPQPRMSKRSVTKPNSLSTRAGVMQVGLSLLEPKPCSTRNAARRSPARTPSGTLSTPCRRKPAD